MAGGTTRPFGMIVLAGGAASRLGHADKPSLIAGGRTLLESVIAAGRDAGAGAVVVVGPHGGSCDVCVREEPPGSGPVPALRRGLAEIGAAWVAVLAADLPFLRGEHVRVLLDAARAHGSGAALADDDGRPQWLAGCWRTRSLNEALADYRGTSLHGLLEPLAPELVTIAGTPPPWQDIDTPEDVRTWL